MGILKSKIGIILLGVVIFVGIGMYLLLPSLRRNIAKPLGSLPGEKKEEMLANPLNGVLVPKSEATVLFNRRPLVVMVGNNSDARPQSNISQADIVYEVVAEGGITRFMPVFLGRDPDKIGPVRSMRAYFLYWILENGDAMVMHDGWSSSPIREVSAVDLIDSLPVKSLFRGGLYGYRDDSRFAPNNEYISTKVARDHADKLGWSGVHLIDSWLFKADSEKIYAAKPEASEINIIFWTEGDYDSKWVYQPSSNSYQKFTGGELHMDKEAGVQLSAKNVIVQFAKETSVNDEKGHLLYANVGSGKAKIFLDGKIVEATWAKADIRARTKFYDTDGNEIRFNRGVIWLAVVPDRNEDQLTVK